MKKVVISRDNEGWALRDLNPRPPACRTSYGGAREVARSTAKSHRSRGLRGSKRLATFALFGAVFALVLNKCSMDPDVSWGSPTYPKSPSMADVRKHASAYEMQMLRKTARCEQPGSGQPWGVYWSHPGPTYVGGYGMAASTYGIGARVTGYPYPPKATPAQQSFVALVIARHYGWSAWGCN